MSNFDRLIAINAEASALIAKPDVELDLLAADLIMRNLAVVTNRVTHTEFNNLSVECAAKVVGAVALAQEIAPVNQTDLEPNQSDTTSAYLYRAAIHLPLQSLQRRFYLQDYDIHADDSGEIAKKMRAAILLSNTAFAAILNESGGNAEVLDAEHYFLLNAMSALKRVKPDSKT